MPKIASPTIPVSTAVSIRRARRRERRMHGRARKSLTFPYPSPPAARRRDTRRQNRDQALFGLENCFDICQDAGYHQDPDVRIGSESWQVNHFDVLDPDASVPSLPCPAPVEVALTLPSQKNDEPGAARASISDEAEHEQCATSQDRLPFSKSLWPSRSKTEVLDPGSTTLPPSILATPLACARVKLPYTFPTSPYESPPCTCQTPVKNYFDDIKIPTPLLYHRRSREQLLARSSDVDIGSELSEAFLLTCGQDIPEPDFQSYKVVDDTPQQTEPLLDPGPRSSTLLPLVDNFLQKQMDLTFCNVQRPPWIVQLYSPSLHKWFCRSSEPSSEPISDTLSKARLTLPTTDTSMNQPGIPCNQSREPYRRLHSDKISKALKGCDLVFPKLPALPPCVVAEIQRRSSTRKAITEFIDDDPDEVRKRWQAFEDAISNPRHYISSSEDLGIALQTATELPPWSRPRHERQQRLNFTACPTSTCMALIHDRTYHHHYAESLQKPGNTCNSFEPAFPLVPSIATQEVDSHKTALLAEWTNDLGFEKVHTEACPVTNKLGASSGFGLEDLFAEFGSQSTRPELLKSDIATMVPLRSSSPDSKLIISDVSSLISTDSESMDEGYCTEESTVEVKQDDAATSEDEWADWDWNDALQEQNDAVKDVDEQVGDLATTS